MKWVIDITLIVILLVVLAFTINSPNAQTSEQPTPRNTQLEFTLEELQTLDEILLISARSNDINSEQAKLINRLQEDILKILG